jgi:hypothetical protein
LGAGVWGWGFTEVDQKLVVVEDVGFSLSLVL